MCGLVVATAATATVNTVSASGTKTATAAIDVTQSGSNFVHNWEECVGSGHMLLGTRVDWRNHLKLAHDELGFKRIRGHGYAFASLHCSHSAVPNGLNWIVVRNFVCNRV